MVGRDVSAGDGVHTYSCVRYATLPSVCTDYARSVSQADETGFYAPSVAHNALPSRPWLGISAYLSIILQYLSGFAIRSIKTYACAPAVPWLANANAHLLWRIADATRRQAHGFCFIKRYLCVTLFQGPTARPVIFLAGCSDMNHRLAV